jgi:hypothetical protein
MSPTNLLKLPGQDLNLEWQDQNLQCYRLHHRAVWRGGILADTRVFSPGNFGDVFMTFPDLIQDSSEF